MAIRNLGFLLNERSEHLIKSANTLILVLKPKYKLLAMRSV